jgi:hypothetical protein
MNYINQNLWEGVGHRAHERGGGKGPHLIITPGDVEEAVHYMQFTGDIDLSELTFTVETGGAGIESFLDIAVFEVPPHCSSHNCDLSRYGVGEVTHFNGVAFLGLCQAGRLVIDRNIFQGHHTQLMVPSEDPMPSNINKSDGTFKVPVQDRNYNVILANCNDKGRPVSVTGQVVFDFEESFTPVTPRTLIILTSVALAICLFFSALSIKIDRGTRADWEYRRFQNFGVLQEEQTQERLEGNYGNEGVTNDEESHALQEVTEAPSSLT